MLIIGPKRDVQIKSLGLTPALYRLTRGEFVHPDLEFRCEKLRYSLEPEDFSPAGLDVVPLWEDEMSITGFYYDEGCPVFLTYYVEDIDSPTEIGRSATELIEFLVSEYGEDEQELRDVLQDAAQPT